MISLLHRANFKLLTCLLLKDVCSGNHAITLFKESVDVGKAIAYRVKSLCFVADKVPNNVLEIPPPVETSIQRWYEKFKATRNVVGGQQRVTIWQL